MRTLKEALVGWTTVSIVLVTQATIVASLVALMLLLVVPDHPLVVQGLRWLRGQL